MAVSTPQLGLLAYPSNHIELLSTGPRRFHLRGPVLYTLPQDGLAQGRGRAGQGALPASWATT